ncbi:ATP-binding protein, partial [Thioclava sp. BHET1]
TGVVASFEPGPIAPGRLLAEVLQHYRVQGRAGRLVLQALPPLPDLIGDADMLQTVLINLIDNALKYAPPPTPVEISAALCGDRLCLRVRDHGIGIPPEELPQIGRRYFRASNAEATAPGIGIGLYSCRRLLAYHDGTLDLRHAPDGGVMAEVSLPLTESAAQRSRYRERERA